MSPLLSENTVPLSFREMHNPSVFAKFCEKSRHYTKFSEIFLTFFFLQTKNSSHLKPYQGPITKFIHYPKKEACVFFSSHIYR
jgi:hypothetical protein